MLALLCLSCSHRNPAGASFCNACGTPLHLKPCTHCDTINQRAAAHCRNCGEAFAFDFSADVDDEIDVEAPVTPHPTSAPQVEPSGPGGRSQLRASALLVAVLAILGLSAFYAVRDPPRPFDGLNGASQISAYVPAVSAAPVAAVAPERPGLVETLPNANGRRAEATGARAALAKPSAAEPKTKAPRAARSLSADRKPRLAPRVAHSPARAPAPAVVAHTPARAPAPAVVASNSQARAEVSACQEGGVLSTACDVRTLAKGN